MPTLYTWKSFLPVEYPLEKSDVCFLSIPFDSSNTGLSTSKLAPTMIKEVLKRKEWYDSELGVDASEKLKMCDLGDLEVVPGSYELTAERIRLTVSRIFEKNPDVLLVVLGGEHLITLPVVEALPKKFSIVQLDAHRDLEEEYLGNRFVHNTWAYHAKQLENVVDLVQIGVRVESKSEHENFKKLSVKESLDDVKGPVYLTLDMDFFDPSLVPDVNNPESNGYTFKDFVKVVENLRSKGFVGFDVVECTATTPLSSSAITAADAIIKFLNIYASTKI